MIEVFMYLSDLFPNYAPIPVSSIENDSRYAVFGSLFIAFTGFERDLHAYIPDAYQKGCRIFVVDQRYSIYKGMEDAIFIPVSDLKEENSRISRLFYGFPDQKLCIICVTGTNGKTTTATMINEVLVRNGIKTAFFGTTCWCIGDDHFNAPNTTPDHLPLIKYLRRCIDKKVTHVVMEAASHALALGRMMHLSIDAAVFTNLTQDHLDFHKHMEEYYLAKRTLFTTLLAESSKTRTCAFINADDSYGQRILKVLGERGVVAESLSIEGKGLINAENIELSSSGVSFIVEDQKVESSLIGRVNVQNAFMAYRVLLWLGLSSDQILPWLKQVSVKGRMEKIISPRGVVFLVDYAHTPDALSRAVMSAQSAKTQGSKVIVVFGAGGDRDKTKRPLMGQAALAADIIIITSDNPRTEDPLAIIEDIKAGIPSDRADVYCLPDRRKALEKACSLAQTNDIVLIAGKGHEEYQIIGRERHCFSDSTEIKQILIEE
ncbi:MAG: UDP-N-acetylmuramoyl-L-alanyl-D-glutamate--2,6-diaminopimelate ligase [Brevinema sp.]